MVELKECDSHHTPLQQMPNIPLIDNNTYEAMTAHAANKSTEFLVDSGASHHICHKKEFFTELTLLPGPFSIQQVQGTVAVTHSGTL